MELHFLLLNIKELKKLHDDLTRLENHILLDPGGENRREGIKKIALVQEMIERLVRQEKLLAKK